MCFHNTTTLSIDLWRLPETLEYVGERPNQQGQFRGTGPTVAPQVGSLLQIATSVPSPSRAEPFAREKCPLQGIHIIHVYQ
jgi:hypothetical protein